MSKTFNLAIVVAGGNEPATDEQGLAIDALVDKVFGEVAENARAGTPSRVVFSVTVTAAPPEAEDTPLVWIETGGGEGLWVLDTDDGDAS